MISITQLHFFGKEGNKNKNIPKNMIENNNRDEIIDKILNNWLSRIKMNSLDYNLINETVNNFQNLFICKLYEIFSSMDSNTLQVYNSIDNIFLTSPNIFSNFENIEKEYHNISFDDKIFIDVSFRKNKFYNCRFRNCKFLFCDCRYIEVTGGTFENCLFWWCDLYRANFQGLIRFYRAQIEMSSLNNTYFGSGALLQKENLKGQQLLQENPKNYKTFLWLWDAIREKPDKMKNDCYSSTPERLSDNFNHRYHELVLVFKSLSSSFAANGFSYDSNWAYVKSKRAERKVLLKDFKWKKLNLKNIADFSISFIYDMLFGYGESLLKIFMTYFMTVLIFTFIFKYEANIPNFFHAFTISLGNMIGVHSIEVSNKNDVFLNMLNLIQSTFGILLTGIFGFILGNKIRNQ